MESNKTLISNEVLMSDLFDGVTKATCTDGVTIKATDEQPASIQVTMNDEAKNNQMLKEFEEFENIEFFKENDEECLEAVASLNEHSESVLQESFDLIKSLSSFLDMAEEAASTLNNPDSKLTTAQEHELKKLISMVDKIKPAVEYAENPLSTGLIYIPVNKFLIKGKGYKLSMDQLIAKAAKVMEKSPYTFTLSPTNFVDLMIELKDRLASYMSEELINNVNVIQHHVLACLASSRLLNDYGTTMTLIINNFKTKVRTNPIDVMFEEVSAYADMISSSIDAIDIN